MMIIRTMKTFSSIEQLFLITEKLLGAEVKNQHQILVGQRRRLPPDVEPPEVLLEIRLVLLPVVVLQHGDEQALAELARA